MTKRFLQLAAFTLVAALAVASAWAGDGSTLVQQIGPRNDAAIYCDGVSGAGQQTLTLKNPGGTKSNYITYLAVWGLATGVPTAATPTVATMTGVGGTTPSFAPLASVYPAAGAQGSVSGGPVPLITPIKCLAGTACAIVGPTAITNMNQAIQACYYQDN